MANERDRVPAVEAGVVAGLAGFVAFLMVHDLWIAPIWFIAPVGAVMAGIGGGVVGAAYAELLPGLPRRPWTSLVVAAGVGIILLPSIVIAAVQEPIYAMGSSGEGTLLVAGPQAAVEFVFGLLLTATLAGAGVGWIVTRRRSAARWTALAGFAFAAGPGHNIPLLGGTPAVGKELAILALVVGIASIVLVEGHARRARTRRPH
ncbi:MAG TPA: hypothetical protein VF365_10450 [Candidatus Limnocylindria bacterium]